jgi:hypothetical protein
MSTHRHTQRSRHQVLAQPGDIPKQRGDADRHARSPTVPLGCLYAIKMQLVCTAGLAPVKVSDHPRPGDHLRLPDCPRKGP